MDSRYPTVPLLTAFPLALYIVAGEGWGWQVAWVIAVISNGHVSIVKRSNV